VVGSNTFLKNLKSAHWSGTFSRSMKRVTSINFECNK
jgi:hypothetical protein